MKVFIFDHVVDLTESYHDGGGAVACADSVDRARAIIAPKSGGKGILSAVPVREFATSSDNGEECWVFPDAGCC